MVAGRAAQRLQEEVRSSKCRATTLHRLLGYKSRRDSTSKDGASGSADEVSRALSFVLFLMPKGRVLGVNVHIWGARLVLS